MLRNLKERIFGIREDSVLEEGFFRSDDPEAEISLEEILDSLIRQNGALIIPFEEARKDDVQDPKEIGILVEEEEQDREKRDREKKDILLYEESKGVYQVYIRKKDEDDLGYLLPKKKKSEEGSYGLFVPAGVTVRRVPQNILGNGVLGRAFIFNNYIEILDSLTGHEYQEVLTHEVYHILYPEKSEMDIRQMTRYTIPNPVYH